jgi:protein-tyrosine phosphatase
MTVNSVGQDVSRRTLRVLFVCTENICRSPLAESLLKHHLKASSLAAKVKVSSAGTRTSRPGTSPDRRAIRVASLGGVRMERIRSRRISERDFEKSDYIFAMDQSNIQDLDTICPPAQREKVSLLLTLVPELELNEVPDPYYGSFKGFEKVFQLVETAVLRLISRINEGD